MVLLMVNFTGIRETKVGCHIFEVIPCTAITMICPLFLTGRFRRHAGRFSRTIPAPIQFLHVLTRLANV